MAGAIVWTCWSWLAELAVPPFRTKDVWRLIRGEPSVREQGRREWESIHPTIPFYVYEGPEFDIFYDKCNRSRTEEQQQYQGDLYFIHDLVDHPWRVRDPSKALIYVVPIPQSALAFSICPGIETSHLEAAVAAVKNSAFYQANMGWDHLVMGSTHHIPSFSVPVAKALKPILQNFTVGHYITTQHWWRCNVQVPQTGTIHYLEGEEVLSADEYLARRPYNLFFQGQTWPNTMYKIRRRAVQRLGGQFSPSILMSTGRDNPNLELCSEDDLKLLEAKADPLNPPAKGPESCKTEGKSHWKSFHYNMIQAKYNLFLRGDDAATSRLFDALMQRTISIFFSDGLLNYATPFQCVVPWQRIGFWGRERWMNADPVKEMNAVLAKITHEGIEERLRLMEKHRADLVWHLKDSRVTSNVIYDTARCLPDEMLKAKGLRKEDLKCLHADTNLVS